VFCFVRSEQTIRNVCIRYIITYTYVCIYVYVYIKNIHTHTRTHYYCLYLYTPARTHDGHWSANFDIYSIHTHTHTYARKSNNNIHVLLFDRRSLFAPITCATIIILLPSCAQLLFFGRSASARPPTDRPRKTSDICTRSMSITCVPVRILDRALCSAFAASAPTVHISRGFFPSTRPRNNNDNCTTMRTQHITVAYARPSRLFVKGPRARQKLNR